MSHNASSEITVRIRNCNSIEDGEFSLTPGALNIKFGPNGVGKSTVAKALAFSADEPERLKELLPFKFRQRDTPPTPTVEGTEALRKILRFDDEFVSEFIFRPNEVLKDSFEVFINTPEYQEGVRKIEGLFRGVRDTFTSQDSFTDALGDFNALRDAFGVTRTGALAKTSKAYKAVGVGGKLANIPEALTGYKEFLDGTNPAEWISWQAKGKQFLDQSSHCPFCSDENLDKDIVTEVSKVYETAAVRNYGALRDTIGRLGDYFEPTKLDLLGSILSSITPPSPEQSTFLAGLRSQVETLLTKLNALQNLSFETLRDMDADKVGEYLTSLRIDLLLLDALNAGKTNTVVDLVNGSIDGVIKQLNDLREQIGKQKGRVAGLIKGNERDVNAFLQSAGYRYYVRIEPTASSYRMIVEHADLSGHLESARDHLSYGEKNALALVLFMYYVRKESPDLVVLDDPVSSFDKTKKYAILHQLFHGPTSIRDYTALLLTHDIEPVVDIVLNPTSAQFQSMAPVAHFLSSANGRVSERRISRSDISTFSQVCDDNIDSANDDIIRCIYLRRLYEAHGDLSNAYQILSSLFHGRETPDSKGDDHIRRPLDAAQVSDGTRKIQSRIPTFDYSALLVELREPSIMRQKFESATAGYEKVQIFRLFVESGAGSTAGDSAFQKFINESYHIENEYLMQLNPRDFDAVPEYIVERCRSLIDKASGGNSRDVS